MSGTEAITRVLFLAGVCISGVCSVSQAQIVPSSAGPLRVETFPRGLDHPWAIAFLPDGRLLVTERPGRMRIVSKDGKVLPPLAGVPRVFASGQGGLLDVALDRGFAQNQTLYLCYAEPTGGGARTAVARARLVDDKHLDAPSVIFHQVRADFNVQSFRLPHRAGAGQQSLCHAGRTFRAARSGAEPCQSPRQDHSHPSGRICTV